jgi:thiamine biosynthesis lipoprotein
MRCDRAGRAGVAALALTASTFTACSVRASADARLYLVHQQRYAMGTMFDIAAYHASAGEARGAIELALTEIERLDRLMSHYRTDSGLARLVAGGRSGFVTVDPGLYDVIAQALQVSQLSSGRFDVTVAPLIELWRRARAEGSLPSAAEVAAAARCVGYDKIELRPPDRIRFTSDCVDLDLGGIGKGYAVERAIVMLAAAGLTRAVVNAGGSSIAAIGAPPGQHGWRVSVGGSEAGDLLLRDESISTSRQAPEPEPGFGEILDPARHAPLRSDHAVSVVGQGATITDALSTALLLLPQEEGKTLLGHFPGTSAVWLSAAGEVQMVHGSRLAGLHGGVR